MKAIASLSVALIGCFFLSLVKGAVTISPSECLAILLHHGNVDLQKSAVLLAIRLPRTILGTLVGAGLGISGAAMQGLFRNPLADPSLIGISSGAALAATVVFVIGDMVAKNWLNYLPAAAFGGALLTTFLVHRLSRSGERTAVATMLLAGVALNALAQACTGLLTFIATDTQLRNISFWRLGSMGGASLSSVLLISPFILIPLIGIPFFANALNAFLLGESEAFHLGINVELVKNLLILFVAMAAGASVAITGIIGFVGLIVPHAVRLVNGPDYRQLLPCSALLGAITVVASDILARTLVVPAEFAYRHHHLTHRSTVLSLAPSSRTNVWLAFHAGSERPQVQSAEGRFCNGPAGIDSCTARP